MMSYISALAIVIFLIAGADLMLLLCEIVFLLAASVIGYFCYPNIVRKNIRKQIGKLRQQGKLPYAEEAEIEFGDNEIIENTPTSTKCIAYRDVLSVQEAEEHIYVYIGAVEAIILPRCCLEDSGEAVLDFLRKNCSQR